MSSPENAPARPPQATFAAWVVILCSVFTVLFAIETLGTLTSLKAREAAQEMVDQTPQLGDIGVDRVLDLLRGAQVAQAVLGGMAVVLAFFAWRNRDVVSRRVLGFVAVPLFLAGMVSSTLTAMFAGVAVIMLFREPVASWFAGRTPPESVAPRGFARGTGGPAGTGGQDGQAANWRPLPGALAQEETRPRQVLLAAVITWISATFAILTGLAVLTAAIVDPDQVWKSTLEVLPDLEQSSFDAQSFRVLLLVTSVLTIAVAVGTIVCAMALLQRKRWGALGLLGLCLLVAMVSILGSFSNPGMVLPAAAAIWVIVLVRSVPTRVWVLTAPRADGSGPGQFADQDPAQFRRPSEDARATDEGFVPPPAPNPYGMEPRPEGRRRADVPIDSESTAQNPVVRRVNRDAATAEEGEQSEEAEGQSATSPEGSEGSDQTR